jgi:hypothetical protein
MAALTLLIIRVDDQYLRFLDGTLRLVNLDKASVFPLDRLAEARQRLHQAKAAGHGSAQLRKLLLTETAFGEEQS